MDVTKGRTKADTLSFLSARGLLQHGEVLPLFSIQYQDWRTELCETKLDQVISWYTTSSVKETHPVIPGEVLVRSSSLGEDNEESSNAGKFLTLQHVRVDDREALKLSIEQVFKSYMESISDADQVLIQPQLTNIKYSGVLLTRSVSQFSPYDAISYDDSHANEADLVTSGKGDVLTWYKFRNNSEISTEKQFGELLLMARDLEKIFGHDHMDVEFAICAHGTAENPNDVRLFLLQARTLVTSARTYQPIGSLGLTEENIQSMARKFRVLSEDQVGLLGNVGTVFSSMVDWNPAEIIGCEPRTLARTMYQYIITERIWAEQRRDYGYRDVTGFPLLHTFGGVPYIDVRVDFNSWIPNTVSTELAQKLINYFLKCLIRRPELHDKVEFEILFTCYFPGIKEELVKRLRTNNTTDIQFSDTEIAEYLDALWNLTNNILAPSSTITTTTTTTTTSDGNNDNNNENNENNGDSSSRSVSAMIPTEYDKVSQLDDMREAIMSRFNLQAGEEEKVEGKKEGKAEVATPEELINTIYRLLQLLKSHGTLPFAGLARCGFVAVQFLRSLNQMKIISTHQLETFMSHHVHTVTKQLAEDVEKVREGGMPEKQFLQIYGHLRPGTYDVLSLRYDEAFDLYFGGMIGKNQCHVYDDNNILNKRSNGSRRNGRNNNKSGNGANNENNRNNDAGEKETGFPFSESTMEEISAVFSKEMSFSWSCRIYSIS